VVTARVTEVAPSRFVVVVSTAPAQLDERAHTDLEILDASTLAEANKLMFRLIGEVVDRAERRGDRIRHVKREIPEAR